MKATTEYNELRVAVEPPYEAVELELNVPVPVEDVWHAIADPPQVRRWLGTLWGELVPGRAVRLDFGDGDFFALRVLRAEPPSLLEYTWRFLGIAPENTITWSLGRTDDPFATVVHLRDWERERTREASLALSTGWADFLARLTRHLATGEWSRYAWREEVDATIELPVDGVHARTLLEETAHCHWLPVGAGGAVPGAVFAVEDDDPLDVVRNTRLDDDSLELRLARRGWEADTRCVVALTARRSDVLLAVHHDGFRDTPLDPSAQRLLRTRIARTWIGSLKRARAAVTASRHVALP